MNAPSVDICTMLADESSLGLILNTNLFSGTQPAKPKDLVCVFDTPGNKPDLTLDKERYDRPSVQIRVVNTDYNTGWALINDIKTLLHGKGGETVGGSYYSVLVCAGEPFMLDRTDNGRARFVINFNIQRR